MIRISLARGFLSLFLVFGFSACRTQPEPPPEAADVSPRVEPEAAPVEPDEAPHPIESDVEPPEVQPEEAPPPEPPPTVSALLNPSLANERAPDRFRVRIDTTRGPFTVEAVREWAPEGADRFYNLVRIGFFEDIAFFRVISGFVVQFGISGDPGISARWRAAPIQDEPVLASNRRGFVTYAMAGPNTRTTQFFINLSDNTRLDDMGFPPFGQVVEGMDVVESLYAEYGEGAPRGRGPAQDRIQAEGNRYLREHFPRLDYIVEAELLR